VRNRGYAAAVANSLSPGVSKAIGAAVGEDERLQEEAATYRAIAQDYMKHGLATLKLRESNAR